MRRLHSRRAGATGPRRSSQRSTSTISTALGLALLAGAMWLGAGCDPATTGGGTKRFVFLTNAYSPFWDAAKAGWNETAKSLGMQGDGLAAEFIVNEGGALGQTNRLRQLYGQPDVVGLAISVNDSKVPSIAEEMRRLRKRGVQVVTVDADTNRERDRDARSHYIGTDNIEGGRALGKATRELLRARGVEKGPYVQFVGITGSANAIERMQGFAEAVGSEFEERDRMGDNVDVNRAKENVRNATTNHPDLVALVGIWSYNGPAIADVLVEKDLREKITAVTFDGEARSILAMKEGNLDVLVVQDPFDMAAKALRLLKALHDGDTKTVSTMFPAIENAPTDMHETGLRVVAPDEGSPLRADMFSDGVEFMKLGEFQSWLAKYGLQGS